MEDPLQKLSNQYRTAFYAIQLKVADTAQTLRTVGSKLSENQIKTFTNQQLNIFSMTQKMFSQNGVSHLYQLLKAMNSNLYSLVVVLIQRLEKLNKKNLMAQKSAADQNQNRNNKHEGQQAAEKESSFVQPKRNKLGGIQLFNQNYARYLEDHRILDQIKYQKQQRILKKKNQLLSCMIYNQLNHKTDVEGEATSNDDIAKYIIQSRNKNSMYNYVPYQQQLQEILNFFQNSQNQANNFLIKKGNAEVPQINGKFSFADFQRDMQFRNRQFQKKVMEKLLKAMQRLKQKERSMEQSFKKRQEHFKLVNAKKLQGQQRQIQTQFQFFQFIRQHEAERRDLQFKCEALESQKVQQNKYIEKENQLNTQISYKALQIQKLEVQVKDLEGIISSLKKMLRQEKSKKHILVKDQCSEKNEFGDNRENSQSKKEKQSSSGSQLAIGVEEYLSMNSNNVLRKISHKSFNWNRKASNDGTSMMSFNQSEKQYNDKDEANRTHGRKFVKYNIQSFRSNEQDSQIQKTKGASFKFNRQSKSKESAIQTEMKQQVHKQQANPTKKVIIPAQEEQDNIAPGVAIKTSKLNFQSDSLHSNITSLSNIQRQEQKVREKSSQSRKNNSSIKKDFKELKQNNKQNHKEIKEKTKKVKENVEIPVKKSISPKQKQEIMKKPILNLTLKQTPKLEELILSKKKITPKRFDKEIILQDGKQSRPETEQNQTKDQNFYNMFEVVQQQGQEEKQSIRNTKRSSLVDLVQSPRKKLDYQSVEKLTKEMRKIKTQKNYFYHQLYSLTIQPTKQLQKIITQTNYSRDLTKFSKSPHKSQKINAFKKLRTQTETSEMMTLEYQNSVNNAFQVFDKIQKNKKMGGDLNSLQKLKDWKKKIQSTYKNNMMSLIDLQNIASVLQISANKLNSVFQNKIHSHGINSVDATQRKFQDLEEDEIIIGNEKKTKHSNLRHNSLSDPCNQQQIGKSIQNQLKIQQIIHFQAMREDFPAKFQKLHKNCKQGVLCSHITKYFEAIMRHIEESRQRQKNLLTLHVQNIGHRIATETGRQESRTFKAQQSILIQPKESIHMKSTEIQNRYLGKSLQKLKKTKISLLPYINQPRISLHSPSK